VNDWLVAQWNKLRRKVDQLVIVALAILLGVVIFLYWLEQQAPPPTIPPLQQATISPTPFIWVIVPQMFIHPKDLRKVPDIQGITTFDMFDAHSTRIQSETVARADTQFTKALQAFNQGDLATAKQVCQDIIKDVPSHTKAINLLKQISDSERKQQEAKSATKTPEAKAPTPSPKVP
jgi:hypothetical protein